MRHFHRVRSFAPKTSLPKAGIVKAWPLLAVGMAAVAVAGCATITKGTSQSVAIVTPSAPGATCTLSSPAMSAPMKVVTPGTVSVEKSKENINVACKKACFTDGAGVIVSGTEAMTAGNIIAGGVVGLGIDAASGALNKYAAETQIHMTPIPGCGASPGPVAARR